MKLIKPLNTCPFCGAKVHEAEGIAGLLFFTCTNYKDCGAIVSFDNKRCNMNPKLARDLFNKRKE